MNTTKINLLAALLLMTVAPIVNAQEYEWKQPPKTNEKVIDELRDYEWGGTVARNEADMFFDFARDCRKNIAEEQLYNSMYRTAQKNYGEDYPSFKLRNFKWSVKDNLSYDEYCRLKKDYSPKNEGPTIRAVCYVNGVDKNELLLHKIYLMTATVVIPDYMIPLDTAVSKAFRNVNQGARLAINQITGFGEEEKESFHDKLIDLLLDKGYKVIAKEYLQKLYEEQEQQKSEVYNNDTKVQGHNFSAVGYYVNVKLSETAIRVQVINVSTGEYEGNATINF